ncbi:MAG: hypothetical protein K1X92_16520, partial [Bacteroidia bacterium]|nr:hypothetical protein [Bacteroidia bacterium]
MIMHIFYKKITLFGFMLMMLGLSAWAQVSITCPGNQILTFSSGCSDALPDYTTLASVSGGTPPFSVTQTPLAGTTITGNVTTAVTIMVMDGMGQMATCTFDVNSFAGPSPAAVMATPSSFCPGTTIQLSATTNGNGINWYTVASGGTSLGSSLSGANFPVTPSGATTYYAEAMYSGSGGASGSQTFNYTGSVQTFTVPPGVTAIDIDARGGEGANSLDRLTTNATAGLGGRAQGTLAVTPGQVISIYVGGQGDVNGAGGFNGGGAGGLSSAGSSCSGGFAGGGGGASDIRVGGTALTNRVIVAGGGGGSGRDYCNGTCQPCGCGGSGGAGGGLTGIDGVAAGNCGFAYPGSGINGGIAGSQTTGGAGGLGDGGGTPGLTGTLGVGGDGSTGTQDVAGGGGGGGYYGGGGGGGASNGSGVAAGGGGGGSSYIGGVISGSTTPDFQTGNGQIVITWGGGSVCFTERVSVSVAPTVVSPPTNVTATPSVFCPGTTVQLNATTNGDSIIWYTVPTGGTSIGSSLSGVNFPVNPLATTTYYAEAVIGGGGGGGGGPGSQTFNYTGSVQIFTVPPGVTSIDIDARGAQGGGSNGGAGGLGARMMGTYAVTPGQILSVVVGQQGLLQVGGNAQNSSGGGGGTFVYDAVPTLLVAAGGGGGKCNYTGSTPLHPDAAGQIGTSGGASSDGNAGGTAGAGGNAGLWSGTPCAGGGAGWLSVGGGPYGGLGYNTWTGGPGYCGGGGGGCGGVGGFGGGGGGGNHYGGGGGGGGYSGGGGGTDPTHGGGGGSFSNGTNQNNTAGFQSGDGQVIISWTGGGGGGCTSTRVPVTVTASPNPPVISCPGTQTLTLTPNCAGTLPDYTTLATVAPGCAGPMTVTQSPVAG